MNGWSADLMNLKYLNTSMNIGKIKNKWLPRNLRNLKKILTTKVLLLRKLEMLLSIVRKLYIIIRINITKSRRLML